MTVELLERYVKSEVENLHLCVDALAEYVERIEARLGRVERQLTLLINSVEDIKVRLAHLEENMVTKEESKSFATKQDISDLKDLILTLIKQSTSASA